MRSRIPLAGLLTLMALAVSSARHINTDSVPWEEDTANEIEDLPHDRVKQFDTLLKRPYGHGLLNNIDKHDKKDAEVVLKHTKNKPAGESSQPIKVRFVSVGSNEDKSGSNSKEDRTLQVIPEDEVIVVGSNCDAEENEFEAMSTQGQPDEVEKAKESPKEEEAEVDFSGDRLTDERKVTEKKERVFTPYKYQRNWPINIFEDIRSYKKNLNRIVGQNAVRRKPLEKDHKKVEEKKDDEQDEDQKKHDDNDDEINKPGARFFFGPQRIVFDTVHGFSLADINNKEEKKKDVSKPTVEEIPINFSSRQEFSYSVQDMLQKLLAKGKNFKDTKQKDSESPTKKEDKTEEFTHDVTMPVPHQNHFEVFLKEVDHSKPLAKGEVREYRYPISIKDLSEKHVNVISPILVQPDASADESRTETTEYSPEDDVRESPTDSNNSLSPKAVIEESVDEKPDTAKSGSNVDLSGGSSTSTKQSIIEPHQKSDTDKSDTIIESNDKSETIVISPFSPITFKNIFSNFQSSLADIIARHKAIVLDRMNYPSRQVTYVSKIVPGVASTNEKTIAKNDGKVIVPGTTGITNSSTSGGLSSFMKNIFGAFLPKISTSLINFSIPSSNQEREEAKIITENVMPNGKFVMQFRSGFPALGEQVFSSKVIPYRADFENRKIILE